MMRVESVPCPTCGAMPGVRCVSTKSGRRAPTHVTRLDLWQPRRQRNAILREEKSA